MPDSYLVVGGCGFLGRHIVEALLARGEKEVAVFDIVQRHFDDDVTFYTGDMTVAEDIGSAIAKSHATCVIHTASPLVDQKDKSIYHKVNVVGTQTVIDACRTHSVRKLVYTSSAGVVYNGDESLIDVDERLDVPTKALDAYNETKAQAEKIVLEANDAEGLLTCALRPAGIFGPGDRTNIPGLVNVMKNGQTKFQIGGNDNLFDWTYVGNVAHAHLLAADRLEDTIDAYDFVYPLHDVDLSTGHHRVPTSAARPLGPITDPTDEERRAAEAFADEAPKSEDDPDLKPVLRTRMDQFTDVTPGSVSSASAGASADAKRIEAGAGAGDDDAAAEAKSPRLPVAGQAFFITNCEPFFFWDYMRAVWKGLGHVAPYNIRLPVDIGLVLAACAEVWSSLTGRPAGFTTFRVKFATQKRYYNVERARRFLGYEPVVGVEEGIRRTLEWYKADQAAKAAAVEK